jgi:glucose-1-phosphate cytidylyltransferase
MGTQVKTVILAGGLGTRISEETHDKPKPMVLIDDKPIIWHLMNIFVQQNFNEFVIALGYKGEIVENWIKEGNGTFLHLRNNVVVEGAISTLDTGLKTQTGGRIKKCLEDCGSDPVFATYGDGLGNVNLSNLLSFHKQHGGLATVTAVRPPARFGYLEIDKGKVKNFGEKNQTAAGWINGGFFVLEPEVKNFITGEDDPFESSALPKLAQMGELFAFQHEGFWQPMDTLREKQDLARLSKQGIPPWLDKI